MEKCHFEFEIPISWIPNNYNPAFDLIVEPANNQPQDIDPPTEEELARAIAICDATPLPEPVVPPTQQTNTPSWD